MSDFPIEARPARWRRHAVLSGAHQAAQFIPSWNERGPVEFIETFRHEPDSPECFEDPVEDAPAALIGTCTEPVSAPAPEEHAFKEWEAPEQLPGAQAAQPPLPPSVEAAPPEPVEPAPPPLVVAPAVIDDKLLEREREAGFEAGLAAARAQMRQEIEVEKAAIRELVEAIRRSAADARQFFAPMERLAVHLAEQLVRGELTLSGQAIRRLVENCLTEFEHRGERLVLRLHPEDMDNFSSLEGELSDSVELVRDAGLARGSVRIEMSDGVVEDLIEHRLEALAKSVLGPAAGAQFSQEAAPRLFRPAGRAATAGADADPDGVLLSPSADIFRGEVNEGGRVR